MGIYSSAQQNNLRDAGEKKASSASLWSGKGFRGSLTIPAQEGWVFTGETCFGKWLRPHDNQLIGAWSHEPNLKDHDPSVQIDSVDPDSARNTNRIVALLLVAVRSLDESVSTILHITLNIASQIQRLPTFSSSAFSRIFSSQ